MASRIDDRYRFRNTDHIGSAAAEDDAEYLDTCFIDSGELSRLADPEDRVSIVLGRTGSGKSALILQLAKHSNAIILRPDELALSYLANSSILQFVSSIGVKIDIFFRLLWRHALIVEVLRKHFQIQDKSSIQKVFDWLGGNPNRKKHKKAQEYLETWGESFWETTEVRVKQLVHNIEERLRHSIGADLPILNLSTSSDTCITDAVKTEIRHRAQDVINAVQIKALSEILDLLDDVLEGSARPYYVIIDQLDEDWVEDSLRLHLIRALVETTKDFRKVRRAKIVVALRSDLLERVYRATRDSGFQEEKLKSLYLRICWTKKNLEALLDRRVSQLIRKKYEPNADVRLAELLPTRVKTGRNKSEAVSGLDFLLLRTMMRPRDAIAFLNCIISHSDGRSRFSNDQLKQAEGEYSRDRLRALQDEWYSLYPNLICFVTGTLSSGPCHFTVRDLYPRVEPFACGQTLDELEDDDLKRSIEAFYGNADQLTFVRNLLSITYRVGLTGLKLTTMEAAHWSCLGQKAISPSEIQEDTRVYLHPCFWRVLGCREHHSAFKSK